ncbi:MAG: chemotaxis protein [Eubacteriales bacterium]
MDTKKANAQTKATEKYQKKVGYMTKGFKLKKEIVESFEISCKNAGISQAAAITKLMHDFIEQNK